MQDELFCSTRDAVELEVAMRLLDLIIHWIGPDADMVDRRSSGEELESRERCDTLRGI